MDRPFVKWLLYVLYCTLRVCLSALYRLPQCIACLSVCLSVCLSRLILAIIAVCFPQQIPVIGLCDGERVFTVRCELVFQMNSHLRGSGGQSPLEPRRWEFDPRSVCVRFLVDKVTLRAADLPVLRFCRDRQTDRQTVSLIALPVATTRRTNGRSPGTFQKAMLLRKSEGFAWKIRIENVLAAGPEDIRRALRVLAVS
jgi:hypothetical protein